jgi:hypothetical protein
MARLTRVYETLKLSAYRGSIGDTMLMPTKRKNEGT